jgi:hypothetical protein
MRPKFHSAVLALLLTPIALLADTPATTQWVVTSAKVSGGGNDYVTSLRIVNPNASVAAVDMTLLPASDGSGDNSGAGKVSVTVPANSTLAIEDVLATKFATAGAGGIRIESTGTTPQAVWVLSQTLVVNARSATGVAGTNGFAIPAQSTDQLVALGETAYVPYISASSSASSGYRTNLFLLSANGAATTVVTVKLLKGDGTVLGTRDVTLARFGQTQINNIAASFGYTPSGVDTNLTATVTVKSGGPVATGASVIDNAIASISYSPPVKVARANNGAYGVLLNDAGFGFSGRLDILSGNGDYMTMALVVPNCGTPPANYVFYFQAFGPSAGSTLQNTSWVSNNDGTISFSGAQAATGGGTEATFSGTINSKYDGSVTGNVTYTRGSGSGGAPCPGTAVTYPFSGSKAFSLTP